MKKTVRKEHFEKGKISLYILRFSPQKAVCFSRFFNPQKRLLKGQQKVGFDIEKKVIQGEKKTCVLFCSVL